MNVIRKFSRGVTFAVLLTGTLGIRIIAEAAETKAKAATLQKAPVKETFIPCHAPAADMSPDGKYFVHVIQDQPMFGILEMGTEQKNSQISLPKKAHDAVFIDNTRVAVSFGPWGEIAVVDIKKPTVGVSALQVGASAEAMCKIPGGRVVVADSKGNSVHLVDLDAQTVLKTIPVKSQPAQMRWTVQDLEIEVADAQGKVLGTVELPRQTAKGQRGAK